MQQADTNIKRFSPLRLIALWTVLFVLGGVGNLMGQTTSFTTVGTTTYTVPAGVTCIQIECWGGGGGGGATNHSTSTTLTRRGGGGGGGAYSKITSLTVTPGQVFTVVVGNGGVGNAGGSTATSGNGSPGGVSEFKIGGTIYCSAAGGLGGGQGWSGAGAGGAGGSTGVGFLYAGGTGANATTNTNWRGGAGGGGAGPTGAGATPTTFNNGGLGNTPGGNGGNGGNQTSPTTGVAGNTIGGGGGGAGAVSGNETPYKGGNGARGEVRVSVCVAACTAPTSVALSGFTSPICSGSNPGTLTATATGGSPTTYTYLWYRDAVSTGVTTQTYAPGNLTANTSIYCVVSTGSGCSTTSPTTTINVASPPTSVTLSATNTTICEGGSTVFSTSLSGGSLGGGSWEYRFELTSGDVLQDWSTTSTYAPTGIGAATYNVVVKVRSSACTSLSTTSNTVVIIANSLSVAPTSVSGTNSICAGSSTTLTTNGGSLGYEAEDLWYSGSCPTECFTEEWATQPYSTNTSTVNSVNNGILNITSNSNDASINMLSIGSFSTASCRYIQIRYRVLSGTAGTVQMYYTKNGGADLSESQNVVGNIISDGNWNVLVIDMGTSANWTGTITGWRFDYCAANLINMEIDYITLTSSLYVGTGTTLTVSPSSTTTYYTLKKGGCNTTTCASTTVTVNSSPTATITPASATTFCNGQSVVLNANTGSGFTYQWQLNGSNIPSATNASYTATAAGTYTVIVTSSGCPTTSAGTVVTVEGPVINPITGTTSISCGSTTTLSATIPGNYGPTGGTITTSGAYTIHTFTSSGNLVVPSGFSASSDYLIVGGGGGGGASDNYYAGGAGGGGAGGMRTGTVTLSAQTYPIVVGTGGAGGTGGASSVASQGTRGTNGNNSSFNSVISTGGGGGGAPTNKPGLAGGSGGGAYYSASGGTATSGQGNNGGLNTSSNGGSGGGGAGAAGGSTNYTNAGGVGGIGLQSSITGSATYYAGGGGGGGYSSSAGGAGGTGGGGTAPNSPGVGGAGTNGLGGGGAGASGTGNYNGGRGGDGVVIIRYIYTPPTGTWSSSNTSVATVNSSTGLVTGVSDGTSTITYSFTYNGCTSTVSTTVTVSGCASITTGTVTGPLCEGSAVSVPYTATGTFNSGNVFTAQLSDASGSFASPTTIGTLSSTSSGTIAATLPTGISGTGFLIRVVSSNPVIIGSSTAAFTIVSTPTTASASSPTLSICGSLTSGSLAGNSPSSGTGSWSYVSGVTGSFSNAASPTSTFTASGYGTSVVRWTISNSPCTASSADVTLTFTPSIGFGNIQSPSSGSICVGGTFNVFGQVWINGITNPAGATTGLVAELGYNTSNSNPSSWTNWQAATFNAQSGNNDEFISTLTGLTAGTYYYAYRYSYNGCTSYFGGLNGQWSSTSDNGILNVYSIPTITLNPASICNGATNVAVSATGASTYELFVNGVSQGAASTTNSWTVPGPLSTGNTVCVRGYPSNDLVMNGAITESFWGFPIATTASGLASSFGQDRLSALYVRNGFGFLNLAVAGNLVYGQDSKIFIFLDTKTGGYNSLSTWTNRSNTPNFAMRNLNGTQFDAGFEPDYIVSVGTNGSGESFLDLYEIATNTNTFIGNTTSNANLISFQANTGAGDYTKGYELRIPANLLGTLSSNIKLFGMLTNNPTSSNFTFLSNQFLTSANAGEGNFGDGAVNFGTATPNPITFTTSPECYTETCRTVSTPTTPTFNPIASICSGTALSALPTTSTNGITGTWSPALNNTATTLYTFTPTAGQCAGSTTLTISIFANPALIFLSPP